MDDTEALSLIRHLGFLRRAISLAELSSKCVEPGGCIMPAKWCCLHRNFVGKQSVTLTARERCFSSQDKHLFCYVVF